MREKLEPLVKEGRTAHEIASILGYNVRYIQDQLRYAGLVASKGTTAMPYGLGDETINIRIALSQLIVDMVVEKNLKFSEISTITGLNKFELARARQSPYTHDWTLSQIERTLKHNGLTMKDIV